jgi:hypothetical protein
MLEAAAHVPTVAAIEANSRQYCPVANQVNTAILNRPGLSAV